MIPTNRATLIYLLKILQEYSDEKHILTTADILSKMRTQYGLELDRRTVYSSVELLIDLGYDISLYKENCIGYFLRHRELEYSEILLLMHAVHAFPFIAAKQSQNLIKKLRKQLNIYQGKLNLHLNIVRADKKTANKQVFWNIEILDEAIGSKKKISFIYMQYGFDKTLQPRRKEVYVVSPYEMVYMNEHYYLICRCKDYPDISIYRVDRMKDIEVLPESFIVAKYHKADVQAIYAFIGSAEYITAYCDKTILSDVLDKFGTNTYVHSINDNYFVAELKANPQGVKFWALQYLPYVEIIEPKWLREEIIENINANRYGGKNEK